MVIDKDNIKILLIILVLNINGTAQVNSANWDVHWANVQITNGSVSGTNVVTAPTISNSTTVNYSIILNTPGDYYEFTVDAVNAGTIDAMIDTIDSKLNGATITTLPDYLKYTVTYLDGVALEPNHQLLHNTIEKYKVRIEYNTDINANQLPASNQTLSLQFTVTYRQATENATEVERVVAKYTVSSTPTNIGQAIPNGITQYSSAAEAMAAFSNRPYYLKHTIQSGVVIESYVEFVVTSAMANANSGMTAGTYYLRGAGSTYNSSTNSYNNDSPYYESNKAVLLSAFGSANCTDYTSIFHCSVSGLDSNTYANGYVYAHDGHWICGVNSDGSSSCVSF